MWVSNHKPGSSGTDKLWACFFRVLQPPSDQFDTLVKAASWLANSTLVWWGLSWSLLAFIHHLIFYRHLFRTSTGPPGFAIKEKYNWVSSTYCLYLTPNTQMISSIGLMQMLNSMWDKVDPCRTLQHECHRTKQHSPALLLELVSQVRMESVKHGAPYSQPMRDTPLRAAGSTDWELLLRRPLQGGLFVD